MIVRIKGKVWRRQEPPERLQCSLAKILQVPQTLRRDIPSFGVLIMAMRALCNTSLQILICVHLNGRPLMQLTIIFTVN